MSPGNSDVSSRNAGARSPGGSAGASASWQTWRLVRFAPWLYLVQGVGILLGGYLLPLVPGLVIRQILDTLTGHAPAGWNAER